MTKESLVLFIGILLTIVPFLGVPDEWRQYSIFGLGFILILIGYALRRRKYFTRIDYGNGERGTDSFVETTEKLFDEDTIQ